MQTGLKISFIVPCFNEEKLISSTINEIRKQAEGNGLNYEIIVVDNMSTDNSPQVIEKSGIKPVRSSARTIGAVRNEGVRYSTGDLLAFLDADVFLDESWGKGFKRKQVELFENRKLITGSHCCVPNSLCQPFFSWYNGIEKDHRNTHLGTGHLIVNRSFFEEIGMFNPSLESGEDYEFCRRAVDNGGIIRSDKNLKAYHMGYPNNVVDFLRRESWHGVSDLRSLDSLLSSKVALTSLVFSFLNFSFIVSFLFSFYLISLFSVLSILLVLFLVVISKFKLNGFKDLLNKLTVSYIYLMGRSLSVIKKFSRSRSSNP